jgi:type VI secretion system secreted protein VgrG
MSNKGKAKGGKKQPTAKKKQAVNQKANTVQSQKKNLGKPSPGAPKAPPPAPAKAKPSVTSGLGEALDAEIDKSPKFKAKLLAVQGKGKDFTIQFADVNTQGSWCDRGQRKVFIDPKLKGNTAAILSVLAHELGHADYTPDPKVPLTKCTPKVADPTEPCPAKPFTLTKEEFVNQNVEVNLKDEGEATLVNIELIEELNKNGGPQGLFVCGTQAGEYKKIAGKYPDSKDRDKARHEIGAVFADKETTSTTKQKYKDYYGAGPAKEYDDALKAEEAKKKEQEKKKASPKKKSKPKTKAKPKEDKDSDDAFNDLDDDDGSFADVKDVEDE